MSAELVRAAGSFLERKTSRRGFLAKVVGAGAVFAAGPLRFLLYPASSPARTPGECSSGLCSDGFHEFCCSLPLSAPGGGPAANDCPSYTYHGGWWKCTSYTGGGLCSSRNVRYYIDCHVKTFEGYSCAKQCVSGICSCRRTCGSNFHYGNCHSARSGTRDRIVCRKVVCYNPGTLFGVCSRSGKISNTTCGHQPCVDCL